MKPTYCDCADESFDGFPQVGVAVERYIAVYHPLYYNKVDRHKHHLTIVWPSLVVVIPSTLEYKEDCHQESDSARMKNCQIFPRVSLDLNVQLSDPGEV